MSYRISLTAENHGYTMRLEKTDFQNIEKRTIEKSETMATLAIINDYNQAREAFDTLNTFVKVCVEKKIIGEDVFRHKE